MSEHDDTPRDYFTSPGPQPWKEWPSNDRAIQERVQKAVERFLVDRSNDISIGGGRSCGISIAHIRSLAESAEVSEKQILLGLLPFWFNKTLLKRSKNLISLKWSPKNFLNISKYRPKRRDARGASIVLSFAYPDPLRKALDNFVSPIRDALKLTTQPHLTILSISPEIPTADAEPFVDEFKKKWLNALQERPRLQRTAAHVEKAAKIRTDEPALLQDGAVVLFGSTSGGFMQSVLELRLLLLRELFPKLGLDKPGWKGEHRQPIWGQTVFARKSAEPAANALSEITAWRPPLNCERLPLEGAKLKLMIYPDRKAQMRSKLIPIPTRVW